MHNTGHPPDALHERQRNRHLRAAEGPNAEVNLGTKTHFFPCPNTGSHQSMKKKDMPWLVHLLTCETGTQSQPDQLSAESSEARDQRGAAAY